MKNTTKYKKTAPLRLWWKTRTIRKYLSIFKEEETILIIPTNDDMIDIISNITYGKNTVSLQNLATNKIKVCPKITKKWLNNKIAKKNITALSVGYRDKTTLGFSLADMIDTIRYCEIGLISNQFPNSEKPYISYMLDNTAPYFDGRYKTDLESQLNKLQPNWWVDNEDNHTFLKEYKNKMITKYAIGSQNNSLTITQDDLLILGQCTGDQALEYTAGIAKNNLELINLVVREYKGKFNNIYYRPHPLNRQNEVEIPTIEKTYGNVVRVDLSNQPFPTALDNRPTIATMSSGAGLEAAIRGCSVITYCTSFYSNWGFTIDKMPCDRRTNKLSPEDVFLHIYMKYCKYLHPYKNRLITPLEALSGKLTVNQ